MQFQNHKAIQLYQIWTLGCPKDFSAFLKTEGMKVTGQGHNMTKMGKMQEFCSNVLDRNFYQPKRLIWEVFTMSEDLRPKGQGPNQIR